MKGIQDYTWTQLVQCNTETSPFTLFLHSNSTYAIESKEQNDQQLQQLQKGISWHYIHLMMAISTNNWTEPIMYTWSTIFCTNPSMSLQLDFPALHLVSWHFLQLKRHLCTSKGCFMAVHGLKRIGWLMDLFLIDAWKIYKEIYRGKN